MHLFRSWLLIALMAFAATPALAQQKPGQPVAPPVREPPEEIVTVIGKPVVRPETSYWIEDAFDAYPPMGAAFAQGIIIWNHPEPWNQVGPSVPPVRALAGMAALGWDIVRLQRNSRLGAGAGTWEDKVARVEGVLEKQIGIYREEGYQRVILAGQEVGGAFALDVSRKIDGLYGIIAFAPNTGIKWGARTTSPWTPNDLYNKIILTRTWDQLEHLRAERLLLLFPTDDEQVTVPRGAHAREILGRRGDLSFLLIDEANRLYGNTAADTADFDAYASCMNLFFSAELQPKLGEFHCGVDEVSLALAEMGVKRQGDDAWFGYDSLGQAIFLELPADGTAPLVYGWGTGADGKAKPGFTTLDVHFAGESFTAMLAQDRAIRGVRIGTRIRLTVDRPDGSRTAVALRRLSSSG
jgi:hypothetical protein